MNWSFPAGKDDGDGKKGRRGRLFSNLAIEVG